MSKAIANNFSALTLSGQDIIELQVNVPGLVRAAAHEEVSEKSGASTSKFGSLKRSLFDTVCRTVKELSGRSQNERLPDEVAQCIKNACQNVLTERLQAIMGEYAHKGNATIVENHLGLKIKGDKWTPFKRAQIVFERQLDDNETQEKKFASLLEYGRIEKRISKLEEKATLEPKERAKLEELRSNAATAQKAHQFYTSELEEQKNASKSEVTAAE